MKITVIIDASGAEDGYDSGNTPSLEEHLGEIHELLRAGNYELESVVSANDATY